MSNQSIHTPTRRLSSPISSGTFSVCSEIIKSIPPKHFQHDNMRSLSLSLSTALRQHSQWLSEGETDTQLLRKRERERKSRQAGRQQQQQQRQGQPKNQLKGKPTRIQHTTIDQRPTDP